MMGYNMFLINEKEDKTMNVNATILERALLEKLNVSPITDDPSMNPYYDDGYMDGIEYALAIIEDLKKGDFDTTI